MCKPHTLRIKRFVASPCLLVLTSVYGGLLRIWIGQALSRLCNLFDISTGGSRCLGRPCFHVQASHASYETASGLDLSLASDNGMLADLVAAGLVEALNLIWYIGKYDSSLFVGREPVHGRTSRVLPKYDW